jgi:hypothetical protein
MSSHPKRAGALQRSWQVKTAVARSNASGCEEDEDDDDASLCTISLAPDALEAGWFADVEIWSRLRSRVSCEHRN